VRSAVATGVVLSLGVLLGLAACGGGRVKDEGSPYSVGEVMARFKTMTGDGLRVEGKILDLRRIGGVSSVSLSIPSTLRKKYGDFRYVVVWGKATTLKGQLLDPTQRPDREPDAEGVYWSKGYDELSKDNRPYWAAAVYRGNVKLIWFPPSRRKKSTASFKYLQAVLADLRLKG